MSTHSNHAASRGFRGLRTLLALCVLALLVLPALYLFAGRGVRADEAPSPDTAAATLATPAVEFLPKPTPTEERILAALDLPTEMAFASTPLQDVVSFLKSQHKIDIQLDKRALEDAAIGADTPITRTVKDVSLRSGLNLLLRDLDVTYLIQNEVVLITTKDKAETELLTLTYPVADLVADKAGDNLIEAITTTVHPTTWDEVGGPGSIVFVPAAHGLVISQTRDVQQDVLTLLRALRAARQASDKVNAGR